MALSITPNGSNQTIMVTSKATVLFSYSTPVAALVSGKWYKCSKFYSKTTSGHANKFIDGRKFELADPQFFQDLLD